MKLFRWKRQREAELDAEIRSHLDLAIRDRMERGETAEQARENARREFGNVGLVKEVMREMWGWASLERLFQDLRYGTRMLMKQPTFTLIAVLTLALGIGATTTIFSALDALVLRPFSFANRERLVMIHERKLDIGVTRSSVAPGNLSDWRAQSKSFAAFVALRNEDFDLQGGGPPERYTGYTVTSGFFDALGVQPLLGRGFTAADEATGQDRVVVLKHSLWQRRFGAQPEIIGRFCLDCARPHRRRSLCRDVIRGRTTYE